MVVLINREAKCPLHTLPLKWLSGPNVISALFSCVRVWTRDRVARWAWARADAQERGQLCGEGSGMWRPSLSFTQMGYSLIHLIYISQTYTHTHTITHICTITHTVTHAQSIERQWLGKRIVLLLHARHAQLIYMQTHIADTQGTDKHRQIHTYRQSYILSWIIASAYPSYESTGSGLVTHALWFGKRCERISQL